MTESPQSWDPEEYHLFGQAFVAPVPEAERAAFLDEVCEALRPELFQDDTWRADDVRLRFAATRPGETNKGC